MHQSAVDFICKMQFKSCRILEKNNKLKSVFISYSKDDTDYIKAFENHLSFLDKQINVWWDQDLLAGDDWNKTIESKMKSADLIIFLISSSLYKTGYIRDIEIPMALERLGKKEKVKVIPVIIRDCAWEDSEFSKFTALPHKAKAISTWGNPDTGWKEVVQGIKKVIAGE